jgi:altered-inheritance-of-mitochondria protein 13
MGVSSPPTIIPLLTHPSETPVRFSSALVDTLTSTSETDSTREKQLELHIQSRVSEELARLEARECEVLASVDQRLDSAGAEDKGLDRARVQAEIEALRKRLEDVPKVMKLEEGVGKAREGVVSCLRKK